ncbi:xanthine dehydrogenase family protein molybdopterin-binding subunit [Candidatus Poribacteria bacterium]|nr:xanthine dehydrogenase family protein molybdopterin-binding subunit [Candidatus Poribacteria bacterium]
MLTWGDTEKLSIVGHKVPRLEGADKVTGRAKYTYDVNLPGMLYGAVLRCPYPHARMVQVDTSKAERQEGVKAVQHYEGQTARFAGDEVAAVAAVSKAVAEDALALIEVEYEELPFVVDVEEAMKPDAPKALETDSNIRETYTREEGDVEAAFEEADAMVDATYSAPVVVHACAEVHGAVAKWDGDNLTVWTSTQGIVGVRDGLQWHFNLPQGKVRVITQHMGGGFGSKFGVQSYDIIAAELSKKAGAPVKLMLTRKDEFLCAGNRPSLTAHIKAGAKKDGTLTAFQMEAYGTGGIGGAGSSPLPYIYRALNVKTSQADVNINAGPACAMRAPGHPPAAFAMESLMDELAEQLGIDPLDFRRTNDKNEIRHQQYVIGAERIRWERRNKVPGSGEGIKKRGIGVGCSIWGGGGGPGTRVRVEIHSDGAVKVMTASQDLGTGTRTIIAQVAAEELGLRVEDITPLIGDTSYPPSGASGGSTTAASVTPAIKATVVDAKQKLFVLVAQALEAPPEELIAKDGKIYVKNNPERHISWNESTAKLGAEPIVVSGGWVEGLSGNGVTGVQFAEVEVDTETGEVTVMKIVALHDCGLPVNPLTVESQIIGAVMMGLGYALTENRVMDSQTGRMTNPNLASYKVPGTMETPKIEPIIFGNPERGVIGIGEPPNIPTAGAIANAVYNAIGVRIRSLPITPDKILTALAEKQAKSV